MSNVVIPLKTGTRAAIEAIGAAKTACPDALYRATDVKMVWFGAEDRSLIGPFKTEGDSRARLYDAFRDDIDAGEGGVPLNGEYTLRNDNHYGLPGGLTKKRIE